MGDKNMIQDTNLSPEEWEKKLNQDDTKNIRMTPERLEELEEAAEWYEALTSDPVLGLAVKLGDSCREIRRAWKEIERLRTEAEVTR